MSASKSIHLAVNVLADTAIYSRFGTPVRSFDIAKRIKITQSRLEIALAALKAVGLISATKGRKGGYRLTKPLAEITVQDILAAVNTFRPRAIMVDDLSEGAITSIQSLMKEIFEKTTTDHTCLGTTSNIKQLKSLSLFDQKLSTTEYKGKFSKGEVQKIILSKARSTGSILLGPNSVFNFSAYI